MFSVVSLPWLLVVLQSVVRISLLKLMRHKVKPGGNHVFQSGVAETSHNCLLFLES